MKAALRQVAQDTVRYVGATLSNVDYHLLGSCSRL